MEAQAGNLSSLAKYFSDEGEAYKVIESWRWPDGPVCPHCSSVDHSYKLKNQKTKTGKVSPRRMWKCAECRKTFTVTVNSIFEDSHIPLLKWLLGAFLLATGKNGVSSHELSRSLNITIKAAWFMSHRLRHAMIDVNDSPFMKGIVEADETYIGGKVRGKGIGRGAYEQNKTPVVTLIQRGGKARSQVMAKVDGANLASALRETVDPAAILMTDTNPSYIKVGREFHDHMTVNHNVDEYVRGKGPTAAHVNTAEGYFSQLKRSIDGTHHHVSRQHLNRYLAEFDHRYNSRDVTDGERMVQTMRQAAGRRLTYRQPTRKPETV